MERVKETGTPNVVGHGSGSGTREIDAASSHLRALAATTRLRGAEPRAVREKLLESSDSKMVFFRWAFCSGKFLI